LLVLCVSALIEVSCDKLETCCSQTLFGNNYEYHTLSPFLSLYFFPHRLLDWLLVCCEVFSESFRKRVHYGSMVASMEAILGTLLKPEMTNWTPYDLKDFADVHKWRPQDHKFISSVSIGTGPYWSHFYTR